MELQLTYDLGACVSLRVYLSGLVCEQSLCEQLLQLDWSCHRNFCPDCLNAGFCDRTCGYCEDPCVESGDSAHHFQDVHPGISESPAPPTTWGDGSPQPDPDPPGGRVLLVFLACFTSFFCACSVVFAALTKRRVNARLGVATTRTGRRGGARDDDVMTVNATFTGFQVEPHSSSAVAGASGDHDGLGTSLIDSAALPVVVTGECSDSLGPEDSTPELGTQHLLIIRAPRSHHYGCVADTYTRCAVITGVVLEDPVATPSASDSISGRTSSWMAPTTSVTAL